MHRSFLRLMALVARRDYLRTVRRRGFVFATLLLPGAIGGFVLLSTVLAPSVGRPAGAPIDVAVVNESQLPLHAPAGRAIELLSRSEAETRLEQGALEEFYLIPPGYPLDPGIERLVAAGRPPDFDDLQRRAQQELALGAVLRASLLAEHDLPPHTLARVLEPFSTSERTVEGSTPPPRFEVGFLLPYAFSFLFVMSIFITSGYLLQSVTEEKENRVIEILLSSVPPLPLMGGKILGLGAAGLTQVAVWMGTGLVALPLVADRFPGVVGMHVSPLTLLLALLFFALGYLSFGAIFAAIGALAPGAREAQQYSGFLGFFAVVPLIFAGTFAADPGSPLVTALALIPLTAPGAMLQLLAISSEPPWPLVIASLASLAIFAALAAAAAARVFRATVLLYGVRPSVRQILAAISARS